MAAPQLVTDDDPRPGGAPDGRPAVQDAPLGPVTSVPDIEAEEPDGGGEGPPLADPLGPAPEASRHNPALVLAITAAVVFALAAAVLGVLLARRGDNTRLDELRETAGQFAEALVTYDHEDPDSHRSAVLELSTGSFRQEYDDAFAGLVDIITQVEAKSEGFVKDIYLSEIDEERAQAVVVVDIEHDGAGGPRTLYDVYFRLAFVEVEDTWKVDQVTDLNFDTGTPAGEPPTDTSTDGGSAPTTTSIP